MASLLCADCSFCQTDINTSQHRPHEGMSAFQSFLYLGRELNKQQLILDDVVLDPLDTLRTEKSRESHYCRGKPAAFISVLRSVQLRGYCLLSTPILSLQPHRDLFDRQSAFHMLGKHMYIRLWLRGTIQRWLGSYSCWEKTSSGRVSCCTHLDEVLYS